MKMKTPRDRYRSDANFKGLVDTMTAYIHQCYFTPSEMRDAAVLASIIYEETTVRKIIVPKIPEAIEECLGVLRKWEDEWLCSARKDGE
jgi:hypothetical protein